MEIKLLGRQEYLNLLSDFYKREKSSFTTMIGRRRIGKSQIILKYQELYPTHSFLFVGQKDSTDRKQKIKFLKLFAQYSKDIKFTQVDERKTDWEQIISMAFEWAAEKDEPTFFFFDEIQWICKKGSGFAGGLKNSYDKYKSSNKLKIVICGSSIQFFKNNVEGPELALMGLRNFAEIDVRPFSLLETQNLFFPNWNQEEVALLYMFVGGIPYYLEQIDETKPFRIAVNQCFFNKHTMFLKAIDDLLNIDLNQAGVLKAKQVLKALKIEGTTEATVVEKTGLSQQLVSFYLDKLKSFNIIEVKNNFKDKNLNSNNNVGAIYYIKDFFINFYFQVLEPNKEKILDNEGSLIFPDIISSKSHYEIKDFSGIAFEYLVHHCLDSKIKLYPKLFAKLNILSKDFEKGVFFDLKDINKQIDVVVVHLKDKNIRLIDTKWVSSSKNLSKFAKKMKDDYVSKYPKEKDQSASGFIFMSYPCSDSIKKEVFKEYQVVVIELSDLF